MFEELIARGPGFSLAGPVQRLPSTLVNGVVEMPVVFEERRSSAWLSEPRSPFVRTGPRERQRAATRERLFDAALAEFRREGFERASVAEIARAAGVSRPSFYAHFPTLDHVLLELAWRLALQVVRRLESATRPAARRSTASPTR